MIRAASGWGADPGTKRRRSARAASGALAGLASLVLLVGLLAAPVPAQEADGASESNEPLAVGVSEILSASRDVGSELDAFARTLDRTEVVDSLEAALPGIRESIEQQYARETKLLLEPSLRDVEELKSEWLALRDGLPGRAAALENRSAELDQVVSRVASLRATWEATRAAARKEDAPAAILARTQDVLARLGKIANEAAKKRAHVLTLEAAVSDQITRIEESVDRLDTLRGQLVRRVLERDQPPVWASQVRQGFASDFGRRIEAAIEKERREVGTFLANEADRVPLHLAVFVALYALLRHARKRVRARSEEEVALAQAADVFESPLSMSLLIGILITPWIYGLMPPLVTQILGAAALVPAVVILRRFTPRALYPLLGALVVFYFLDRLRELTITLPLVSRMIFLFEMFVAVVFLALLLRPARLAEIPQWAARSRLLRVLGTSTSIALAIFSVALVAEIFGYSRLGHLLGGGVLQSAYVALVAYASVRIGASLVALALRVRPLDALRMVQRDREVIRRRLQRAIRVLAVVVWAVLSLDVFALWVPLSEGVVAVVTARAHLGAISISLGDVLAFVGTLGAAFFVSRFLRFALEEDVYPRLQLGRGVPYAISTFLNYGILLLGFVLAVAAMGIDLDRFALLAGAFGVGIGFGLQNVVNNFASGLILLTERPIQVGDTIDAGDSLGEVVRIGIRSSTVRTWSGAELIVPNAQLISERVINWTLSDRQRRIDVPVGVAYGTDRDRVLALLTRVGNESELVMNDPAPRALFKGFGDSSLDFELRAWTSDLDGIAVIQSSLAMGIGDALAEAGIEIPFPQRDLHVRSVSPPVADRFVGPAAGGDTDADSGVDAVGGGGGVEDEDARAGADEEGGARATKGD